MSRGQVALRLGLGAVGVVLLLCVLGLVLTHLPRGMDDVDARVDQWLAGRRTHLLDALTWAGSGSANTQSVLTVAVLAFFVLRWWLGRWYESWVVAAAVVGELLVFLVVTAVVHRPRPPVHHLDVAPPTSSFPSGHTGAAVAVYGCLAVVLWRYLSSRTLAAVAAAVLLLVPFAVGASRLYRGMHYPTDVLAGALGGAAWLAVVLWVLLPRMPSPRAATPELAAARA
jgi:undecaprenyl-diphosphatase